MEPTHAEQIHNLRIHMGYLCQKREADPARPVHLLTAPGVGYRLVAA
jgi:two-component system KDP operon response regulator KdpE